MAAVLPAIWRDEASLLARLRMRDERAFAAIVDCLDGSLRRLARLFVADSATAAEIAQDTWVAVIDGLDAFEGRSSLRTWIMRICVNKAKTRGVRESRHESLDDRDDTEGDLAAVDPARFAPDGHWTDPPSGALGTLDPEGALLDREARTLLMQALESLPARQRAVVTMRDLQGLEVDEVCNILAISETNQRVLLHRARATLRTAVETLTRSQR